MADKFLDDKDSKELKEMFRMTRIGRMIFEDGKAEGREEGREEGRNEGLRSFVKVCKRFVITKDEVIDLVVQNFAVTREEAQESVEKYW